MWQSTNDCDPYGPKNPEASLKCGETTCYHRSGFCDCNGNGVLDNGTNTTLPEPRYTCASNQKYYTLTNGTGTFKKPPITCNAKCRLYNCTYMLYTKADCRDGDAEEGKWSTEEGTSTLAVYGWATYFELDYTYKSVMFNHVNCEIMMYSGGYFNGVKGTIRSFSQDLNPASLTKGGGACKNLNMTFFGNSTKSFESLDTCIATTTTTTPP